MKALKPLPSGMQDKFRSRPMFLFFKYSCSASGMIPSTAFFIKQEKKKGFRLK